MNRRRVRRAVRFGILLFLALLAAYVVRYYEIYAIPPVRDGGDAPRGQSDQSMSPLYKGGTRVLCRLLDPEDPLARGTDVVYAMLWDGQPRARFGRVRAVAGDEIGADREGLLTVNGERIGPINIRGKPMGRVPDGKVFILAINPQETRFPDSRKLGFIDRTDVRARIVGRWPFGGR